MQLDDITIASRARITPTAEHVRAVEKALGVTFPDRCEAFITALGVGHLGILSASIRRIVSRAKSMSGARESTSIGSGTMDATSCRRPGRSGKLCEPFHDLSFEAFP
jgi:hypothetical protein